MKINIIKIPDIPAIAPPKALYMVADLSSREEEAISDENKLTQFLIFMAKWSTITRVGHGG